MTDRGFTITVPTGYHKDTQRLIERLNTQLGNMSPHNNPMYGSYEYAERAMEWRRNAAESAHSMLMEVIKSPPENPLYRAVLAYFNGKIPGFEAVIKTPVDAEDLLSMINGHNVGGAIGTRRAGPAIADIVTLDKDTPLFDGPPPALPANVSTSPLEPRTDIKLKDCAELLEAEAVLAASDGVSQDALFDANAIGPHPRMSLALQGIVGALMLETGKAAHELRALEFAPRMIIGAMLVLARMGLGVSWKGTTPLRDFHTRQQLARLPQELRQRIADDHTADDPAVDLAIANSPFRGPLFKFMHEHVARGGLLAMQTHEKFDADEAPGWQRIAQFPFQVMPLMMARPVYPYALSLQVWQKMV